MPTNGDFDKAWGNEFAPDATTLNQELLQDSLEVVADSILKYGDLTYDMLVVFQAQMLDAIDVLTTKGIPAVIVGTTSETKQGLLGPTKTDSIILRVTEAHRLLLWEAGIALKYAPRDTLVVKKDDN